MNKNTIGLTILGIILILALSGCFSHRFEVQHNPDGSGMLIIETIFNEEYIGMIEDDLFMDDADDDIFGESLFTEDDLADSPNIRSVNEDRFVDPETGALHQILEIEIVNILEPVLFDQEDDLDAFFTIVDRGDGTFLFTVTLEAPSDFADEGMDDDFMMDPEMFRFMLQDSTISWQLHAAVFIDGDPQAVFDTFNNTVNWELPMYDVLFAEEPLQIFAIYRVETTEAAEAAEPEPQEVLMPPPDPDTPDTDIRPPVDFEVDQPSEGFFGLPNWVPIVLVAVLCLGSILVVIAAVVIILVVRKRNQNPDLDQPE